MRILEGKELDDALSRCKNGKLRKLKLLKMLSKEG